MSDPTPGDLPAWLFEMPNPVEDDPKMDAGTSGAYVPGSSPKPKPIWTAKIGGKDYQVSD
jgi:hypothetical protein